MFESTQKSKESSEKPQLVSFRNAAFLASTLFALSPEGAKAWDTVDLIPPAQIEKIFDEINLPNPAELTNVEVTYVKPSENGKYVVHIRQQHRMTDTEYLPYELSATADVQGEIYETIKAIEKEQMGTTYLPEGYSEAFISELLIPEAQTIKEFKQMLATHLDEVISGEMSITDLVKVYGKEHTRKTGTTFSRVMYGELMATGWYLLDNIKEQKGITVDAAVLGNLNALIGDDPEAYLNFYQGGLVRAYNAGFISDVVGCENHNLFKQGMTYAEVLAINPEREKIVANCFQDQLQKSASLYVVTVYGGAHNFTQEIDDKTGYIVLTPNSYNKGALDETLD